MNIYFIGFMGSGKSYYSKMLSREVMMPAFDMDHIIEDLEGENIHDIFYGKGEPYFRELERSVLKDLTKLNKGYLIACGGGTPCYQDNVDLMNAQGATIYLKASKEYLFDRLKNGRMNRPLISMMDNLELKKFIATTLEEREQFYKKATKTINIETITLPLLIQTIHACRSRQ
jgi:shikimate kinase